MSMIGLSVILCSLEERQQCLPPTPFQTLEVMRLRLLTTWDQVMADSTRLESWVGSADRGRVRQGGVQCSAVPSPPPIRRGKQLSHVQHTTDTLLTAQGTSLEGLECEWEAAAAAVSLTW